MTQLDKQQEQDLTVVDGQAEALSEDQAVALDSQRQVILDFWFATSDNQSASYAERRKVWFGKKESVDQYIYQRFAGCYEQIAAGHCQDWQATPEGCLTLVIVLDQFPRNMFRGTPKAFATDRYALKITQRAIARGFDQKLPPIQRLFLYFPLEHSEDRNHQQQSVTLFQALASDHQEFNDFYSFAMKHQAVIERFGRFPHRNAILERPNTPEEVKFLKQPGSSF